MMRHDGDDETKGVQFGGESCREISGESFFPNKMSKKGSTASAGGTKSGKVYRSGKNKSKELNKSSSQLENIGLLFGGDDDDDENVDDLQEALMIGG